MALPLLVGLATSLVPSIARHLFGEGGAEVAKQVVGVATELFGTDDPAQIEKAIAADPKLAFEFKVKVLELADREAQRKHDLLVEELNDVKNARAMQTASAGKTVPSISAFTLLMFFTVNSAVLYGCFALFGGEIKINNVELAVAVSNVIGHIHASVNNKAELVYGFFFGSSVSARSNSQASQAALADIAKQAAKR